MSKMNVVGTYDAVGFGVDGFGVDGFGVDGVPLYRFNENRISREGDDTHELVGG